MIIFTLEIMMTEPILVLKFYSTPSCSNTDFPNSSNCANDSRYMKFMGIHPSNNTVLMSSQSQQI